MNRSLARVAIPALLLTLTACGSTDTGSGDADTISVVTSFYPLQFAVEQVGGEHVSVTNLTPAGAEPHDLELSPRQVLEASRADHLVYLAGFQPSVDDAADRAEDAAFDVSSAARLGLPAAEHAHEEEGHAHEGEGDHEHDGGHGHQHAGPDPHFWLDPTRYADVAEAIAEELAADDPAHAADYRANAEEFTARLTSLDEEIADDLSDCRRTDLVTGHAAFAYFAHRYGFHQVAVTGLSPDVQPSAAQMAELIDHIEAEGIPTVYAEPLVPSDLAETVARDSGAEVTVLDPVEGVTEESAGTDYFEIMRSNRDAVHEGQECR